MDNKYTASKEFDSSVEEIHRSFRIFMRAKPYLSVGVGWHGIIEDMSADAEKIMRIATQRGELGDNPPYVFDIKEKYGTLRVSVYGGLLSEELSESLFRLVDETELKSGLVCEECGKPGCTRDLSWIRTLCEDHYRERK